MAVVMQGTRADGTKGSIVSYEGCVLDLGEMNYRDDSDFYAVVWSEEGQCVQRVEYATTRFGTYDNHAAIDATPEVIAKAAEAERQRLIGVYTAADERASRSLQMDRRVRVVRTVRGKNGRPVGTEGVIVWKQEQKSRYGTWSYGWRYGVKTDDGQRFYCDADVLEVVNPEQYRKAPEEIERAARANSHSWRSNTYAGLPVF